MKGLFGSMLVGVAVGSAVGAVAVMMMPHNNPVRKLATKAADSVEDAACKMGTKMCDMIDGM